MVVEDDHLIREAIAEALDEEGFEVVEAANGREALDKLHSEHASLVLLDLMMPVMDGEAFLAMVRADPALAGIPVILASANGAVRHAAGAAACLSKPYDLAPLLRTIEQVRART